MSTETTSDSDEGREDARVRSASEAESEHGATIAAGENISAKEISAKLAAKVLYVTTYNSNLTQCVSKITFDGSDKGYPN